MFASFSQILYTFHRDHLLVCLINTIRFKLREIHGNTAQYYNQFKLNERKSI